MELMDSHPGELRLRRWRAGELQQTEVQQLEGHLAGCSRCRVRLRSLELEQEQFEREISFDRFAAGVQRAAKTAAPSRVRWTLPARWALPALGMAAAVLVTIVAVPLVTQVPAGSRRKGGSEISLRIALSDGSAQRTASGVGPEPLSPGERVRLGYQAGPHRYLLAISIDQQGAVTVLYDDKGRSLSVGPGEETRYLPASLEFTGSGLERVIVVLSDEPLEVSQVKRAAEVAYHSVEGDLRRLAKLEVPGEQFHRLVLKP